MLLAKIHKLKSSELRSNGLLDEVLPSQNVDESTIILILSLIVYFHIEKKHLSLFLLRSWKCTQNMIFVLSIFLDTMQ